MPHVTCQVRKLRLSGNNLVKLAPGLEDLKLLARIAARTHTHTRIHTHTYRLEVLKHLALIAETNLISFQSVLVSKFTVFLLLCKVSYDFGCASIGSIIGSISSLLHRRILIRDFSHAGV